jgi:hypothetical protein
MIALNARSSPAPRAAGALHAHALSPESTPGCVLPLSIEPPSPAAPSRIPPSALASPPSTPPSPHVRATHIPTLRSQTGVAPLQLLFALMLGIAGSVRAAPALRMSLSATQSLSLSVSRKSGRSPIAAIPSLFAGIAGIAPASTLSATPSPSLSRSRYAGIISLSPAVIPSSITSTEVAMPSPSSSM